MSLIDINLQMFQELSHIPSQPWYQSIWRDLDEISKQRAQIDQQLEQKLRDIHHRFHLPDNLTKLHENRNKNNPEINHDDAARNKKATKTMMKDNRMNSSAIPSISTHSNLTGKQEERRRNMSTHVRPWPSKTVSTNQAMKTNSSSYPHFLSTININKIVESSSLFREYNKDDDTEKIDDETKRDPLDACPSIQEKSSNSMDSLKAQNSRGIREKEKVHATVNNHQRSTRHFHGRRHHEISAQQGQKETYKSLAKRDNKQENFSSTVIPNATGDEMMMGKFIEQGHSSTSESMNESLLALSSDLSLSSSSSLYDRVIMDDAIQPSTNRILKRGEPIVDMNRDQHQRRIAFLEDAMRNAHVVLTQADHLLNNEATIQQE
jgi:hypothetical protein